MVTDGISHAEHLSPAQQGNLLPGCFLTQPKGQPGHEEPLAAESILAVVPP